MVTKSFHFAHIIDTQAQKYQNKPVFYDRYDTNQKWEAYSWNKLNQDVNTLASAFVEIGIDKKNSIAQFSQNRKENLIVDFGSYSIGGVIIPIYPTSSLEQTEFIVNDAEVKIIFVEDQRQYDIAVELMQKSNIIKYIVAFEKDIQLKENSNSFYFDDFIQIGKKANHSKEVEKRRKESNEQDTACIFYTSGTSGNPKGVVIKYDMLHATMTDHQSSLPQLTEDNISITFLPLTHVFERAWTYLIMFTGGISYINHFPQQIQKTIKEVRPTAMCAVPRFWEKVYNGVQEIMSEYSPLKKAIITWALAIGEKYNIEHIRTGKKANFWVSQKYKIADKLIFSKLKTTLGIENARILPVGGAKFSNKINKFFSSMGIPLMVGYGLTESTASVTFCYPLPYDIKSVGKIMVGIEAKIGKGNEILLKGRRITPNYYKNDNANKEGFTEDGWFRTGDAGYIKDGQIFLTERLKDLFKTSNGKYIAPQKIETLLNEDKYIDNAVIVADERNFVTAIISPDFTALKEYAKENNISYKTTEELIAKKEIIDLIDKQVAQRQAKMAHYEQVKKFTLVKSPFAIETGELTNTLKIRRAVIMQKYKLLIDKMYQ